MNHSPERVSVAFVTGAASGIGEAVAHRLAFEGFRVVVSDINRDAGHRVAAEISARGGKAICVVGDVSSETDCLRMVSEAEASVGPVDLLVNNAGHAHQAPFEDMSVADFDRMFAVHVRGAFLMTQAVIKGMLARGDGNIINISSQLAHIGGVHVAHYAAAKAALLGMTKSLAREVSARGVRVNAVAPGPIITPLQQQFDPVWLETKKASLPLGRFGRPEEVAATVAFLASSEAALYVGQTLGPNSGDVML